MPLPALFLPPVAAALAAGGVVLAVHAGASPHASTADGPALGIAVRSAHPGSGSCSVRAGSWDADCSAVDLFAGEQLSPGSSHTTVVVARNDGRSALRDLDLVPGLCSSPGEAGDARSLCSDIRLRITTVRADGRVTNPVQDEPLAALRRVPVRLAPLPAHGQQETVRLTVTLDRTAAPDLLGRSVTLPLSWHAGG